jgi:hypothetical protein
VDASRKKRLKPGANSIVRDFFDFRVADARASAARTDLDESAAQAMRDRE